MHLYLSVLEFMMRLVEQLSTFKTVTQLIETTGSALCTKHVIGY